MTRAWPARTQRIRLLTAAGSYAEMIPIIQIIAG